MMFLRNVKMIKVTADNSVAESKRVNLVLGKTIYIFSCCLYVNMNSFR